MILLLDNTESVLDPQGTDALEIYTLVDELSRFNNICLGVTSRISTIPLNCKRLIIPTLSMESACDIFYRIYNGGGRSNVVSDLVRQLDFHALSITLLATAASHNMWGYDRLEGMGGTESAGAPYGFQRELGGSHRIITHLSNIPLARSRRPRATQSRCFLPPRHRREQPRLVISIHL
jgi:hypothetical protein